MPTVQINLCWNSEVHGIVSEKCVTQITLQISASADKTSHNFSLGLRRKLFFKQ